MIDSTEMIAIIIFTVGLGVAMAVGDLKAKIELKIGNSLLVYATPLIITILIMFLVIYPWISSIVEPLQLDKVQVDVIITVVVMSFGPPTWWFFNWWIKYYEKKSDNARREIKKIYTDSVKLLDQTINATAQDIEKRMDICMVSGSSEIKKHNDEMIQNIKQQINSSLQQISDKHDTILDETTKTSSKADELISHISKIDALEHKISYINSVLKQMALQTKIIAENTIPDDKDDDIQSSESLPVPEEAIPDNPEQPIEVLRDKIRKYGLKSKRGQNKADPHIFLHDKHGNLKATMLVIVRSISDEPSNRTKRIHKKTCAVSIQHAESTGVDFILCVYNTENGRMWLHIVKSDSLKDWKGTATQGILAQNDEATFQTLEEHNGEVIAQLGGVG